MSPVQVLPSAQELAADAIAARDATIPPEWRLPKTAYPLPLNVRELIGTGLSSEEKAIIDHTAIELRDALAARKYTAVQVATAYCKAAALAQEGTNCLVELFPQEALERARWLDAEFERTGKPVGPLHGVVVSLKDHISLKGHDSPCGFLDMVGKNYAEDDAHMVSVLRDAGAIFHTKTTNPQSLMHLETECYLGRTCSPYNTDLTSGGSSGGQGALMGIKGSALGVGTDIGGSVRSPAAACGVFAFKPSVGRVPYGGCNMPVGPSGYEGILCSHGPFGHSVDDLELYMKVMVGSKPWLRDPTLHVKPWCEVTDTGRKLRIGILRDDGVVAPVAPIKRALDHAVAKLEASGQFEVVDWSPPASNEAWDIISSLYWPDGGEAVFSHIAQTGEPVLPLTQWILDEGGPKPTLDEVLRRKTRRDEWRTALAAHWQASGVDVVLSPVGPTPAPAHGTAKYWNYTSYWNLANYPAAVFPTGLLVDPAVDQQTAIAPRNASERFVYNNFNADQSNGAPLALQLVGYIGHEEDTLSALRKVVDAVRVPDLV